MKRALGWIASAVLIAFAANSGATPPAADARSPSGDAGHSDPSTPLRYAQGERGGAVRFDAPVQPARLELPAGHGSGITRCELCHTTASWSDAKFDHGRTGFPLVGAHATTGCRECHVENLQATLPRTCAGCHRDAHRGELGQRCEGCHDARNWKSLFDADAHRRTNFPLQGRHAAIPCNECHGEVRDRVFTRAATPCVGCHEQEYLATSSSGVNHLALGFSTTCRDCHNAFRFRPASFAAHERCFSLSGPHAGIACLTCHRTLAGAMPTGSCSTNTAACSSCHAHLCSKMDPVHAQVAGYACQDRKCYECHTLAGGGG